MGAGQQFLAMKDRYDNMAESLHCTNLTEMSAGSSVEHSCLRKGHTALDAKRARREQERVKKKGKHVLESLHKSVIRLTFHVL